MLSLQDQANCDGKHADNADDDLNYDNHNYDNHNYDNHNYDNHNDYPSILRFGQNPPLGHVNAALSCCIDANVVQ